MSKWIIKNMLAVLSIMFVLSGSVHAATLIDFDFNGLPGNNLGPLTATDSIADHVILADPGLDAGGTVGVSGSNFATGEFNWWKFNDEGNPGSGWMTCTLEAESSYLLDLSSVTISLWRNGAGAPEEMRFLASTDGVNFAQVGDIITETISGDLTFRNYTFDLSSLGSVSNVILRFSPLPGSATVNGWGNVHVNDWIVEGTAILNPLVPTLIAPVGDFVDPATATSLQWGDPTGYAPVGYDLVFRANDANFIDTVNNIIEITDQSATSPQAVTLDYGTTYYWRVDAYEPNGVGNPIRHEGSVWPFTTKVENELPVVEAGDNVITWVANAATGLQLAGSVTDDGIGDPITILWEAYESGFEGGPTSKVSFANDSDPLTAVTISEVGTYILTLTATDDNGTPISDSMRIQVYSDACAATKTTGEWVANYYDRNEDCIVNMEDFVVFALEWLNSTALSDNHIYAEEVTLPDNTLYAEVWLGIEGADVNDLLADTDYPNSPDGYYYISNDLSVGGIGYDNYGTRIRGYIVPETTAEYIFYIASDNASRLFLNTSGTAPVNTDPALGNQIAECPAYVGVNAWGVYPEQISAPVTLTIGQYYYVEILHKELAGSDHFSVGWSTDGGTTIEVIPGSALRLWLP